MQLAPSEADLMKDAIAVLRNDSTPSEEVLMALEALQVLVEPIDNANGRQSLSHVTPYEQTLSELCCCSDLKCTVMQSCCGVQLCSADAQALGDMHRSSWLSTSLWQCFVCLRQFVLCRLAHVARVGSCGEPAGTGLP